MPYQYGQGVKRDLTSLLTWIKKSTKNYMKTIDFDFTDLETEIKKIIKYNSKLTKEIIIENTTSKELFCLFKEYQNKLIEKNEGSGIFCVDDDVPIFLDKDIRQIIKEMKK